MSLKNVSLVLSPTLQLSHRLLNAFFLHSDKLFTNIVIKKYIPPISSLASGLPTSPADIETELKKQESLLALLHSEMTRGSVSKYREELLWEVQRIVTMLKRKLKSASKGQETAEQTAVSPSKEQLDLRLNIVDKKDDGKENEENEKMKEEEDVWVKRADIVEVDSDKAAVVNVEPDKPKTTEIHEEQTDDKEASEYVTVIRVNESEHDETEQPTVSKEVLEYRSLIRKQALLTLENYYMHELNSELQKRVTQQRQELEADQKQNNTEEHETDMGTLTDDEIVLKIIEVAMKNNEMEKRNADLLEKVRVERCKVAAVRAKKHLERIDAQLSI